MKTPQRIVFSLATPKQFHQFESVSSHTGQEFIVLDHPGQNKLLEELRHCLSNILPKQTVIPGKVDVQSSGYWLEPDEMTLLIYIELENKINNYQRLGFRCRTGDGYCLVEMNKYSNFSRDEHQEYLAYMARFADVPILFKSDLQKSSSKWSEITICDGRQPDKRKYTELIRCTTESGMDVASVSHFDPLVVAEHLKLLEANITKVQNYPGNDLFNEPGVWYGLNEVHYEHKTCTKAICGAGTILHAADDTWQTNSHYISERLGPLVPGISNTHIFKQDCLSLESIGTSHY